MEFTGPAGPLRPSVPKIECRICLQEPAEICELFRAGIPEKLMAVASVQVSEGDGLPSVICVPCNQLLDASYDFQLQIQRSDAKLRRILHLKSPEDGVSNRNIVKALIADVISSVISSTKDDQLDQPVPFPSEASSLENNPAKDSNEDTTKSVNFKLAFESSETQLDIVEPKVECPETMSESYVRLPSLRESRMLEEEEKPLSWRTGRLRCGQCIKTFRTKLALQRHSIVHKRKTKLRYVCHVCEKQYSSVSKLKSHMALGHDEKRVVRKSRRNFKSPKEEQRGYKFVCKVCAKRFTYRKSFLSHMKRHPECKSENVDSGIFEVYVKNEEIEEAEEDGEDADEDEMEEEDEEDEELPAENLQCTQCGKFFATKRNLKRHVSTHSGLKYNCTTCGKGFSRVDKLKDHEQSKHKIEIFENSESEDKEDAESVHKGSECAEGRKKDRPSKPHQCALCPKTFVHAHTLANHMERHTKEKDTQKRFLCEVCSKCFAQSGSLVAHMRTHTGVKPYVCNVCSRAFTKSTYLQLHLRTHSGEKPYICQYCSRAFARANTLARHITMHTGEAKYHCQICTKSFRRLTSLNEHTYTHTGQRPYACKICTKRYNNAGSLYAHTKKCKAQQLTNASFGVGVENSVQQSDGGVSQVVIYSQRKIVEENAGQNVPTPQYLIANVHNQKSFTSNIIQPFSIDDPNVYAINSKQFKNPYYTIYPNM